MSNGLPYYKAYPRDFIEGTIGMPFEVKCAYRVVLDLIYMQGGNLPDDARYISGLLGCTVRKWNSIRSDLIALGKLQVIGEFLTNYRAIIELETLSKLQDKQRTNASGRRKNNKLEKPRPDHTEPDTEPEETAIAVLSSGDVERAFEAYAGMAKACGLGVPRVSSAARRSKLSALLKIHGLAVWIEACGKVGASDFCRGQSDTGWKADLDFMLQAKSWARILEGFYDNRTPPIRGPTARANPLSDAFAAIGSSMRAKDELPDTRPVQSSVRYLPPAGGGTGRAA